MQQKIVGLVVVMFVVLVASHCADSGRTPAVSEEQFKAFLADFEAAAAPATKAVAVASFNASISGEEADYTTSEELQLALTKIYADPATFARIEVFRASGAITDPLLERELDVLHRAFLAKQLPEQTLAEIISRQTAIEQRFNTHRATINGSEVSDNELAEILRTSTDSDELEQAWLASKEIGQAIAGDIIELVQQRNQAAEKLGFSNFQVMQLALSEQNPQEIENLFDELDDLTRDAFAEAKTEIDAFLAERLGLKPDQLRPWHYQDPFFQEGPAIYPVELDAYYADQDLVGLTETYYAGIGLPVADMMASSDLFEKPGKYQHAFCSDIDRQGDVRVLASVKPNAYWMNTMLHEFGHAVYAKYNDPEVPWLLRDAAHAFTTEAIANLFGRFAANPGWLREMVGISEQEEARIRDGVAGSQRLQQLVFSRWSQVMFRFEKSLYENPEQNLDELWWNLVERYQLLQRPEGRNQPDWAAKIHVALYPAYYHNYLMGELMASQLHNHIGGTVLAADEVFEQTFVGRAEVGAYLQESVFEPGMTLPWNELIEKATGEPLTAQYYVRQFIGG